MEKSIWPDQNNGWDYSEVKTTKIACPVYDTEWVDLPETLCSDLEDIDYEIASYEYSMSKDKSDFNREFCETKIKELIARRENLNV